MLALEYHSLTFGFKVVEVLEKTRSMVLDCGQELLGLRGDKRVGVDLTVWVVEGDSNFLTAVFKWEHLHHTRLVVKISECDRSKHESQFRFC